MHESALYTREYYTRHREPSRRSAEVIVPIVLALARPRSVIDVGCGLGTWLAVFKKHGVRDVLGVDGEWVDPDLLEIPEQCFLAHDLREPLCLDRQFDLILSLEVAEHLPPECAEVFIDSLVALGPVVLFSAGQPFQAEVHHLNAQWLAYWAERFAARGYAVIDSVRKRIWDDDRVSLCYVENTLLCARRERIAAHPALGREAEMTSASQLSIVHPKRYVWLQRVRSAIQDVAALVSPHEDFILVDQDGLGGMRGIGRRAIPFLERDGRYFGPPRDDETAIAELERLRREGARFMVIAWPAFWWLDYYSGFHRYLRDRFLCRLANDRVVIFDLQVRV